MENILPCVQLGIEELSLAISLMGKPEVAKGLLYSTFGQLSAEGEEARLLAAGHSLMAKDLLRIVEGQSRLVDDFGRLLAVVIENDFIIHYDRKSGSAEEGLAYFVKGKTIVEQRMEQGVVYHLSLIPDSQGIIMAGCRLFEIQETTSAFPEMELPTSVLDRAKEASDGLSGTIQAIFRQAGLPDPLGHLLAEDFRHMGYRGAVMRIEGGEGQLKSEKGLLLLRGTQRIWLFPLFLKDGQPYTRLVAGTLANFTREVRQLLD